MAAINQDLVNRGDAFRRDWIDTVETGNRDFFEEAEGDPEANFLSISKRMVEALKSERAAIEARSAQLRQILG